MRLGGYKKHPARNDIVIALVCLPLYFAAVGRYGLRVLIALAVSIAVGLLTEVIASKIRKKELLGTGFVSWILIPLVLPPVFPLWMLAASVFFGTVIGVAFFGGYGNHLASPVALGWTFAALSYSRAFGFGWSLPFPDVITGYSRYAASVLTIDHPIIFLEAQRSVTLTDLLYGNVPQTPGMAVPLLVIGCGLLLYLFKAVDVRSSLIFLGTVTGLSFSGEWIMPGVFGDPYMVLTGNLLLAGFFVFPDRRTAPRTKGGRYVTALLAGIIAFLIRSFSTFPCGVFFAVIFANVFSPIIDEGFIKAKYGRPDDDNNTKNGTTVKGCCQ
ncbi:MAG: RnfABCDGE type electron transport complex subunit D [Bacteroidales bacterium]|nr:RnfABCDGE type electron transport complex subunit D [Candidatus Latescibacterota bacterium]